MHLQSKALSRIQSTAATPAKLHNASIYKLLAAFLASIVLASALLLTPENFQHSENLVILLQLVNYNYHHNNDDLHISVKICSEHSALHSASLVQTLQTFQAVAVGYHLTRRSYARPPPRYYLGAHGARMQMLNGIDNNPGIGNNPGIDDPHINEHVNHHVNTNGFVPRRLSMVSFDNSHDNPHIFHPSYEYVGPYSEHYYGPPRKPDPPKVKNYTSPRDWHVGVIKWDMGKKLNFDPGVHQNDEEVPSFQTVNVSGGERVRVRFAKNIFGVVKVKDGAKVELGSSRTAEGRTIVSGSTNGEVALGVEPVKPLSHNAESVKRAAAPAAYSNGFFGEAATCPMVNPATTVGFVKTSAEYLNTPGYDSLNFSPASASEDNQSQLLELGGGSTIKREAVRPIPLPLPPQKLQKNKFKSPQKKTKPANFASANCTPSSLLPKLEKDEPSSFSHSQNKNGQTFASGRGTAVHANGASIHGQIFVNEGAFLWLSKPRIKAGGLAVAVLDSMPKLGPTGSIVVSGCAVEVVKEEVNEAASKNQVKTNVKSETSKKEALKIPNTKTEKNKPECTSAKGQAKGTSASKPKTKTLSEFFSFSLCCGKKQMEEVFALDNRHPGCDRNLKLSGSLPSSVTLLQNQKTGDSEEGEIQKKGNENKHFKATRKLKDSESKHEGKLLESQKANDNQNLNPQRKKDNLDLFSPQNKPEENEAEELSVFHPSTAFIDVDVAGSVEVKDGAHALILGNVEETGEIIVGGGKHVNLNRKNLNYNMENLSIKNLNTETIMNLNTKNLNTISEAHKQNISKTESHHLRIEGSMLGQLLLSDGAIARVDNPKAGAMISIRGKDSKVVLPVMPTMIICKKGAAKTANAKTATNSAPIIPASNSATNGSEDQIRKSSVSEMQSHEHRDSISTVDTTPRAKPSTHREGPSRQTLTDSGPNTDTRNSCGDYSNNDIPLDYAALRELVLSQRRRGMNNLKDSRVKDEHVMMFKEERKEELGGRIGARGTGKADGRIQVGNGDRLQKNMKSLERQFEDMLLDSDDVLVDLEHDVLGDTEDRRKPFPMNLEEEKTEGNIGGRMSVGGGMDRIYSNNYDYSNSDFRKIDLKREHREFREQEQKQLLQHGHKKLLPPGHKKLLPREVNDSEVKNGLDSQRQIAVGRMLLNTGVSVFATDDRGAWCAAVAKDVDHNRLRMPVDKSNGPSGSSLREVGVGKSKFNEAGMIANTDDTSSKFGDLPALLHAGFWFVSTTEELEVFFDELLEGKSNGGSNQAGVSGDFSNSKSNSGTPPATSLTPTQLNFLEQLPRQSARANELFALLRQLVFGQKDPDLVPVADLVLTETDKSRYMKLFGTWFPKISTLCPGVELLAVEDEISNSQSNSESNTDEKPLMIPGAMIGSGSQPSGTNLQKLATTAQKVKRTTAKQLLKISYELSRYSPSLKKMVSYGSNTQTYSNFSNVGFDDIQGNRNAARKFNECFGKICDGLAELHLGKALDVWETNVFGGRLRDNKKVELSEIQYKRYEEFYSALNFGKSGVITLAIHEAVLQRAPVRMFDFLWEVACPEDYQLEFQIHSNSISNTVGPRQIQIGEEGEDSFEDSQEGLGREESDQEHLQQSGPHKLRPPVILKVDFVEEERQKADSCNKPDTNDNVGVSFEDLDVTLEKTLDYGGPAAHLITTTFAALATGARENDSEVVVSGGGNGDRLGHLPGLAHDKPTGLLTVEVATPLRRDLEGGAPCETVTFNTMQLQDLGTRTKPCPKNKPSDSLTNTKESAAYRAHEQAAGLFKLGAVLVYLYRYPETIPLVRETQRVC